MTVYTRKKVSGVVEGKEKTLWDSIGGSDCEVGSDCKLEFLAREKISHNHEFKRMSIDLLLYRSTDVRERVGIFVRVYSSVIYLHNLIIFDSLKSQ